MSDVPSNGGLDSGTVDCVSALSESALFCSIVYVVNRYRFFLFFCVVLL